MPTNNRYQFQPWPVRLWRRRHLLAVPFVWAWYWRWHLFHWTWPEYSPWRFAVSGAHIRMKWVWSLEEVKQHCQERRAHADSYSADQCPDRLG